MRKAILVIFTLLSFSDFAYSQELFTAILDSLSAKNKIIDTYIPDTTSTCYFKMMSENKNFLFRDKDVVLLSSYKDFNLYLVVAQGQFKESAKKTSAFHIVPKLAILFDKKQQKCFLLKYSTTVWIPYSHYENYQFRIKANFSQNIQDIVSLDESFTPVWGAEILAIKYRDYELGRIVVFGMFFSGKDESHISFNGKWIGDNRLNINSIDYGLLSNYCGVTQSEINSILWGRIRVNIEHMFNGVLPGFW